MTSEKERCRMPPVLNTEQSATMNGDSSDFGDLACLVRFLPSKSKNWKC